MHLQDRNTQLECYFYLTYSGLGDDNGTLFLQEVVFCPVKT
jgi:hypothetical protein